ncbi:MAG: hypothetical protein WA157_02985 [Rhodoferax ferrireducens]
MTFLTPNSRVNQERRYRALPRYLTQNQLKAWFLENLHFDENRENTRRCWG